MKLITAIIKPFKLDEVRQALTDGLAAPDTHSVSFTVTPVNDAPTLNAIGNVTVAGNAGTQEAPAATVSLSGIGSGACIMPSNKNSDWRTKSNRGTQRARCCVLDRLIVMISKKKRRHQNPPASVLSLETSSATEATLMPAFRPGGSMVETTFKRGVISMPKSAGVFSSIGFFLAFIMFGKDA